MILWYSVAELDDDLSADWKVDSSWTTCTGLLQHSGRSNSVDPLEEGVVCNGFEAGAPIDLAVVSCKNSKAASHRASDPNRCRRGNFESK